MPVMPRDVVPVHHPDKRHVEMPYAPALLVRGGSLLFLSGLTAAAVYHSHPHREEEFDLPTSMRNASRLRLVPSDGCSFNRRSASTRAASTNCGSFNSTSDWSGVAVASRFAVQTSRDTASKVIIEGGGEVRRQKV